MPRIVSFYQYFSYEKKRELWDAVQFPWPAAIIPNLRARRIFGSMLTLKYMYEIHIKLKKKTQRDLEIIACGLNSKKTKKKPNLCRSQEMRESLLSNYKKKICRFRLVFAQWFQCCENECISLKKQMLISTFLKR